MIRIFYLVFILSGSAGLIYESIWSRYLGLLVGHSAYGQILVLVIFLGGMSLGAVIAGSRSERLRDPLRVYAAVEFLVGVVGLLFHDAFLMASRLAYDVVFPLLGGGMAGAIAKWGIAGLLILPQSILLGATFPLMTAGILRRSTATSGRVLALLYFANSLGAAGGVLVAGFYLLGWVGLPGTLTVAATINLFVALVVWVAVLAKPTARPVGIGKAIPCLAREVAGAAVPGEGTTEAREVPLHRRDEPMRRLWHGLLAVSAGTAIASFIYEIGWIRMLSLSLGSATHSFELMLSAFILGLALGAYWVRGHADRFRDPVRALGIAQWLKGAMAIATLPIYMASFGWVATLLSAFDSTPSGYLAFNASRYLVCLAVMLPATFCAGTTLPLITRTLLRSGVEDHEPGDERAVGLVYGVNTLGSIVGAAVGGLLLMPVLGLKWLIVTGALLDMGLGLALLPGRGVRRPSPGRRLWLAAFAGMGLLVGAAAWGVRFDPAILTSGVYRYGRLPPPGAGVTLFYQDGRTATVSVERDPVDGTLILETNGKPDASITEAHLMGSTRPGAGRRQLLFDESTQVLISLVVLAHAPGARTAANIGQGSGISSHYLLGSSFVEHMVTIEIEPEMIEGSRLLYPANRRVFDDPRSEFAIDDARSYFASCHRLYDVILSEPSNPWVSGVSGLFTSEFYSRVRTFLTEEGVFGQWIQLHEITDDLVLSVLNAVDKNLDSFSVYRVSAGDLLIVASKRATLPVPDWSVLRFTGIQEDLRRIVPLELEHLRALRVAGGQGLGPLLEGASPTNSDFHPVLDLGAERARYAGVSAQGLLSLQDERFDIMAAIEGQRREFATTPVNPVPGIPRLRALALGARLRGIPAPPGLDVPADEGVDQALYRKRRLETLLSQGEGPSDWRLWMQDVLEVEKLIHGGTAGVADESFYGLLDRFMRRTGAPADALRAVDFMHALAVWDFGRAAREADGLIESAGREQDWVPVDLLRDGAVVSRLLTGDVAGARKASRLLAPRVTGDAAGRFRSSLLEAHLIRVERGISGPRQGRIEP